MKIELLALSKAALNKHALNCTEFTLKCVVFLKFQKGILTKVALIFYISKQALCVLQNPVFVPELLFLGYLGLRLLYKSLGVSMCRLKLEIYEMWRCLEFPFRFHLICSGIV